MTYHTILAVYATQADVTPVTTAIADFAAGTEVHLIGCHGEPSQFVVLSAPIDVPDAATIAALYEQADTRMREVGDAFDKACDLAGLSHEWRPVRSPGGDSAISALASARTADLVVVRQPNRDAGEDIATNVEALLFEGGRPVLFLPSDGKLASPIKRILIAWDGSRESARATQDALPLLKAAEAVNIVVVDPDKLPDIDAPLAGTDIASCLSRHGIHVNITTVSKGTGSTAEAIASQVAATNSDLVVMGAYTHQRLREWLFGGVTRAFLENSPVPVLMSR
ncbi:universal stress protein UspA-like protein [Hoeflea sp. IMCC20628]|uniref:universal stress protein n=1 Tax=Hoeflea sp. IMCC20628 TaxID=1620421 RepID=UPI00063B08B6|nr:universal stress protein [Hoeflea sp. IMCC20628]AKI00419.1 universal stress protein UspA-like protein [Hoeflea sp. IMCC20628]